MTKIVSQLARGLSLAVGLIAGAAQAQPAWLPERKLEPRWQVEIPPDAGRALSGNGTRLRVQGDGRISFALGQLDSSDHTPSPDDPRLLLVTVDSDGRVVSRAPVHGPADRTYTVVPLQGGDFLVHYEDNESLPGMQLRRIAADGTERGAWRQMIHPAAYSVLLDAMARNDGTAAAAVSIGPGPNDVLAVMLLGPGNRPMSDHRLQILMPGHDYVTRVHPLVPNTDDQPQPFLVIGNGIGRSSSSGTSHFALSFSSDGGVLTAVPPIELGPEYILCHALSGEGRIVFALSVLDNDRHTILRWLSGLYGAALEVQRPVPKGTACNIGLRGDGSGAIWLEPRQLLAFSADQDLLWRATLDDVRAISWMPDGDVVALHDTDTGVRLVRYGTRP